MSQETKIQARYAIVTLLMRGDAYLPGALVLGHSLRKHCTMRNSPQTATPESHLYDTVCMVTKDAITTESKEKVPGVSQAAIDKLKRVYDVVLPVEYMRFATRVMRTEGQQRAYGSMLKDLYTKWQILSLREYQKVLFIDADALVVSDISDLFNVEAPAAAFTHSGSTLRRWRVGTPYPYNDVKHGEIIDDTPDSMFLRNGLQYGTVAPGNLVLLKPDLEVREALKKMIEGAGVAGTEGYGHGGFSGPDEQSITEIYMRLLPGWLDQVEKHLAGISWDEKERTIVSNTGQSQILSPADYVAKVRRESLTSFVALAKRGNAVVPGIWHYISSAYDMVPQEVGSYRDIGARARAFHFLSPKAKPWYPDAMKWVDNNIWWQYAWDYHDTYREFWPGMTIQSAPPRLTNECTWCQLIRRPESKYKGHTLLTCPVLRGEIVEPIREVPAGWETMLQQAMPSIPVPVENKHFDMPNLMRTLPYDTAVHVINKIVDIAGAYLPVQVDILQPRLGAFVAAARSAINISKVGVYVGSDSDFLKACMVSPSGPGYEPITAFFGRSIIVFNDYLDNNLSRAERTGPQGWISFAIQNSIACIFIVNDGQTLSLPVGFKVYEEAGPLTERTKRSLYRLIWVINETFQTKYLTDPLRVKSGPTTVASKLLPASRSELAPTVTFAETAAAVSAVSVFDEKRGTGTTGDTRPSVKSVNEKVELGPDKGTAAVFMTVQDETKWMRDLRVYLESTLKDQFKITDDHRKALLHKNYDIVWQAAFRSDTVDPRPDHNYQRLETYGDKALGRQFDFYVMQLPRQYTSKEITRLVKEYQSGHAQGGYTDKLGLFKYLRYLLPPGVKPPDAWKSDVYESFMGALDYIGRAEGKQHVIDQAMQYHMKQLFVGGFDEDLMVADSDKGFVDQVFMKLGYSSAIREEHVNARVTQDEDSKIWSVTIYKPRVPKDKELVTRGLLTREIPNVLAALKGKGKDAVLDRAWALARKNLGITWKRANEISQSLRVSAEAKGLNEQVRKHLATRGYADFRIERPAELSYEQLEGTDVIFLMGIRHDGTQVRLLSARIPTSARSTKMEIRETGNKVLLEAALKL